LIGGIICLRNLSLFKLIFRRLIVNCCSYVVHLKIIPLKSLIKIGGSAGSTPAALAISSLSGKGLSTSAFRQKKGVALATQFLFNIHSILHDQGMLPIGVVWTAAAQSSNFRKSDIFA